MEKSTKKWLIIGTVVIVVIAVASYLVYAYLL